MGDGKNWLEGANKIRRRAEETADYFFIRAFYKRAHAECYDNCPRIALVTVNFNTLHYLKLFLLTLTDSMVTDPGLLRRIVIVDNASKDGSRNFLHKLEPVRRISIITNAAGQNHAKGLRTGIKYIDKMEKSASKDSKTNYYLVADTDIIITRKDLWPTLYEIIQKEGPDLLGEIQHDVGIPYVHPSFMLIKKEAYHGPNVLPFINSGAPAFHLQKSLRAKGAKIIDFPVRKNGYIVHRGRGAISGIRQYSRFHSFATVETEEHFHGNSNGKAIWDKVENAYADLLGLNKEAEYIERLEANSTGANLWMLNYREAEESVLCQ